MKIYLWDNDARNSLHIDLWSKDMLVSDMNVHVVHNLLNLADSYQRATGNLEGAEIIRQCARQLAENVKSRG